MAAPVAPPFTVASHHINVAAGDSAIHVLEGPRTATDTIIVCHAAVLIDGGVQTGAETPLQCTITKLQDYYGPFQFDSVVITHWDTDHFTGIVNLLCQDFRQRYEATNPKPSATDVEGWRSEFLKYDQAHGPLSTLYAPYWGTDGMPSKLTKNNNHAEAFQAQKTPEGYVLDVTFRKTPRLVAKNVCKLCCTPDKYIGRELFSGESLGNTFGSPQALRTAYNNLGHSLSPSPGLFCIGGDTVTIVPSAKSNAASSMKDTPVAPHTGDGVGGGVGIINRKGTASNRSSIACLIMDYNGKPLHYFAGDAEHEVDTALAKWINPNDKNFSIPAIKLSHHGSVTSNSPKMFTALRPANIIISAGESHGHPTWETILYLYALKKANHLSDSVYATCVPHWFNKEDYSHINTKNMACNEDRGVRSLIRTVSKDVDSDFWSDRFLAEVKANGDPQKKARAMMKKGKNLISKGISTVTDAKKMIAGGDIVDGNALRESGEMDESVGEQMEKEGRLAIQAAQLVVREMTVLKCKEYWKALVPTPLQGSQAGPGGITFILKNQEIQYIRLNWPPVSPVVVWTNPTNSNVMQLQTNPVLGLIPNNTHAPDMSDAPSPGQPVYLLDTDPMAFWLGGPGLAGTKVVMAKDKDTVIEVGGQFTLKGFNFSLDWDLSFSSTFNNGGAFGSGVFSAENGPDEGPSVLIMSLDPSAAAPQGATLETVAQAFQFDAGFLHPLAGEFNLALRNSPTVRNAVWFSPTAKNTTFLRLEFEMDSTGKSTIEAFLHIFIKQLSIVGLPRVIGKKKITQISLTSEPNIQTRIDPELIIECAVATESTQFNTILIFHPDRVEIRLQWDTPGKGYSIGQIPQLLEDVIEVGTGQTPDLSGYIPKWLGDITLREIVLTISDSKISEFNISFEAPVNALNPPPDPKGGQKQVSFLLAYRYPQSVFSVALMTSPSNPPGAPTLGLIPEYEKYLDIPIQSIVSGNTLASSVPLLKLIDWAAVVQQPHGITLDVYMLNFQFSSQFVSFSGAMSCDTKAFAADVPPLIASSVQLHVEYWHATKAFTLRMDTTITLHPQDDAKGADGKLFDPVVLTGSFDYSESKWTLSMTADELNIAALYSLMDPECCNSTMSMLQEITIRNLSIDYQYENGAPTQFVCGGLLILGNFELKLNYKYLPKQWDFKAEIGSTSRDSSVKKILQSICPSLAELIPEFLDMPLTAADSSDADGLEVLRTPDGVVVFKLMVNIGKGESLSFLQLQYPAALGPKEPPAPPPPTKRVVCFTMGALPILSEVPLAGTLLKPLVDELDFVWVHMDEDKDDGGLTSQEVDLLNNHLPADRQLRYKDVKDSADSTILISTGFHFMVVDGGVVKLDYQFGHKKKKPNSTPSPPNASSGGSGDDASGGDTLSPSPPGPDDSQLSGDPVAAPLNKTIGSLSISNVGLDLVDSTIITLKLDAKCKLGPIEFELLGFSIGLDFSKATLNNLSTLVPTFGIDGLAASFDAPPLELAGLFEKKGDIYFGGCILGLEPYTLMAVGSYGVVHIDAQGNIITPSTNPPPGPPAPPPAGGSTFQSVFVFATLDGPLADVEFAEITGVKLGFGYNSRLVNPKIENIFQFPLLANQTMDPTDPLAMLNKYFCQSPAWVVNEQDTFWIAAGFTVIAFELLTVSVVAVMEFNPALELVLLADAVASMPKLGPDHELTFVSVEVGIIAAMDFGAGTLQIDAQLSPNSFIFLPACSLTGGFALYSWFSGSAYAGDWVCSVGGYHVSFKPPSYYPTPKPLGVSFRVDSALSIEGHAYFALTPKVCMGGGHLSAVFTDGGLVASFDAWADFLINFNPFFFSGDIGVTVSVSLTVHEWIINFHVSEDISASLNIQGPPFSGVLHIDVCHFGFSCHFGAGASIPPPLTPEEFLQMLNQAPAANNPGSQVKLVLEAGSVPSVAGTGASGANAAGPWVVRAGSFVCRLQSKIPFNEAGYNAVKGCGSANNIYIKPMHISDAITSVMNITVADTTTGDVIPGFRLQGVVEALPTSIWGPYSEANDPALQGNNLPTLLSGDSPTVELMTGLRLLPPPAMIPSKDLPAFAAQTSMAVGQGVYTPESSTAPPPFQPLPANPAKEAWEDVKKVWSAGDLTGLVTACEGAFGWDLSEEKNLPSVTINKLEMVYMAAPMMTA